MVNKITFINEEKYFITEFQNFNEYEFFCLKIIEPFLIPMENDGLKGYGMELPFIMNETGMKKVREHLGNYTSRDVKFNKILSFFNNIEYNKCFYIFVEEVTQELCETCKESLKFYNIKYDHDFVHLQMQGYLEFNDISHKITEQILKEYELVYHSYIKKIFLGEKDKKKRICRFCGKTMEEGVTYINEAHAIPAFFGNKTLFQNEECDECNSYFGENIEIDLDNYTKMFRVFSGIEGRNGIPEINNKDKKIFYSNVEEIFKGPVIVSLNKDNTVERNFEVKSENEFTPSNVYRIFCKMFFSVVNSEVVRMFDDIIKWIRYDEVILEKLPLIAFCFLPNKKLERPEIVTYIKKLDMKRVPYAFMEFRFGHFVYIIQIPSKKNKDQLIYKPDEFEAFLKKFKHFENANFQYKDFSSRDKTMLKINFNF
ncbi:MAG: HNH endonuclease [Clostridium sp.]|uniref:HNH endonuclease n=1 Tax=Clostridium sp. TaxID=1506 RepID=UPI002FC9FAF7